MSRPLRVEFPGAFYHVMSRGNERRPVFKEKEDYDCFLEILAEAAGRWELSVHAYALMGNHYHLLIEAKGGILSVPMRHINGVYTQFFNRKYKRVGHLFQGRFKALLVEKDSYLLVLSRYIHQNPRKAKLARRAQDYPYSSYSAFLGTAPVPPWLNTQETLHEFGSTEAAQQKKYQDFIEAEQSPDPLPKAVGQLVLGSQKFLDFIKKKAAKARNTKEYPQYKLWLPKSNPDTILQEVCDVFKVNKADLLGGRYVHGPSRPIAMSLLRDQAKSAVADIARMFNLDDSAVSVSIKRLKRKMRSDEKLKEVFEDLSKRVGELSNVKM